MFSGKYKKISEYLKDIKDHGRLFCGKDIEKCEAIAKELTEFTGNPYECLVSTNKYLDSFGNVIKSNEKNHDDLLTLFRDYKLIPATPMTPESCLEFTQKLKKTHWNSLRMFNHNRNF